MDVPTPQGAGAAPGLVYTAEACPSSGGVYTTEEGPELHLDLSTLQRAVQLLELSLDYFEILLSIR
jgi:hypothetical protein